MRGAPNPTSIVRFYALVAGVFAMGLFWVAPASAQMHSGGYKHFPLWLEVPAPRFAVLAEGQLRNRTRWGAFISRYGKINVRTRRPCITVSRITKTGEFNSAIDCGPLLSGADGQHPVYASVIENYRNFPGGPLISETVMGLTFDPSVVKVAMTLASGGETAMKTRELSVRQQHKANVPALRYIALGMMRDACVETVTGYDVEGAELFVDPTEVCP